MAEPFGVYLENPRRGRGGRFVKGRSRKRRKSSRRRRSSARRRRSSRRRRKNPALIMNPRRRRRSARRTRRSRSRRRSYSRNPFRLSMGGGGIKRTLMAGLGLAGGELAGDLLSRAAIKVGAGKLFDAVKVPTNVRAPLLRIAVGLFAGPLLKMARVPSAITQSFGAVNVASGLLALTAGMRQQVLGKVGLGDYELADVLVGDDDGLDNVLRNIRRRGAFHAEDEARLQERKALAREGDWTSHPEVRDDQAALMAVKRLVAGARKHGRRVHVLHVSSAVEMEFLATAKDVATVEAASLFAVFIVVSSQMLGDYAYMMLNPRIRFS